MNYIFLVNFTHFAGDGKSRPTAKGRYKYSNMKKKKQKRQNTQQPFVTFPASRHSIHPRGGWCRFQPFKPFLSHFLGDLWQKDPLLPGGPVDFRGGWLGILVEKGRIWYQSSLSFTPGRATRLASSRAASGDGGGRRGDMWHPGQPCRVPGGSSPDFKSRRLKKKKTKKKPGGRKEGLHCTGATRACVPGVGFFLVLLFLLKYESPFQRSLLRCDYPRAIKKERKKNLQIPTTAFVHQSSCSQAPTE